MFLSFTFQHASMEHPLRVGRSPIAGDEKGGADHQHEREQTESLRPINVFSGANGSGKSFFLRSIVSMAEALAAWDASGDPRDFTRELIPEPGDFWACSYLVPGIPLVLDYRVTCPGAEEADGAEEANGAGGAALQETLRWRALPAATLEHLDPSYEDEESLIQLSSMEGEARETRGLSLLDPSLKDAPELEPLLADPGTSWIPDEDALLRSALRQLRESLGRVRFEYHSNYLESWDALPTERLRHMAASVDGAYPRVDDAWLASDECAQPERLEARILEQKPEVPTAYEKLCVAASRLRDDERFRTQIDQFSSAEKRLLLLSSLALDASEGDAPWLILVENPDDRLYRENAEAFVLLLRELSYYRPGTQWILSSSRSTFLDNFYPEEIWQFRTNFSDSAESLMVFRDPVNLGTDDVVQAMVDEGVPLSELAYEGYF